MVQVYQMRMRSSGKDAMAFDVPTCRNHYRIAQTDLTGAKNNIVMFPECIEYIALLNGTQVLVTFAT